MATLGSNWKAVDSASWNVVSGFAVKDAGDHIAVFDIPNSHESMIANYEIHNPVEGNKYYLIVNYVDSSNYHYAEYHHDTSSFISLYVMSGGTATLIKSVGIIGRTDSTVITFSATFADGEFCAGTNNAVLSTVEAGATAIVGGFYAGMGGNTPASAQYDNFYIGQHSATKAGCGQCLCTCDGAYVPPTLKVTFRGSGRLAAIDGCTVPLIYNWDLGYWEAFPIAAGCCGVDEIRLVCPPTDALADWSIYIYGSCTDSDPAGSGAQRHPNLGTSSCDPLFLEVGPVLTTEFDFTCFCGPDGTNGQFTIEITE